MQGSLLLNTGTLAGDLAVPLRTLYLSIHQGPALTLCAPWSPTTPQDKSLPTGTRVLPVHQVCQLTNQWVVKAVVTAP